MNDEMIADILREILQTLKRIEDRLADIEVVEVEEAGDDTGGILAMDPPFATVDPVPSLNFSSPPEEGEVQEVMFR